MADETAARAFLAAAKEAEPDADHHCYAYRLGEGNGEITYYSDAGESSGTAGRPMLGALLAAGITNTAIVVSRYFGGKKLGIPGLIDAYRTAANEALAKARTAIRAPSCLIEIALAYGQLEAVRNIARKHGAEETGVTYGSEVALRFRAPLGEKEAFQGDLMALGLKARRA